jgi:peptidyl-prolyl cis-trans isomerase SurA
MTDLMHRLRLLGTALTLSLGAASTVAQLQIRSPAQAPAPAAAAPQQRGSAGFNGDYIIAVVNSDLVTAGELQQRIERMRAALAGRGGASPPVTEAMRQQALESLIEERVLITFARDSGTRVDDAEVDRAVQSVATQNKLTLEQLRERLGVEGIDFARFRSGLRDQILLERVREREVIQRTRVTDADIDKYLAERNAVSERDSELNIAQILIPVPEGASTELLDERQARADAALARVRGGEDFATVARELSEDSNRASGGEIGMRSANRLPDAFVAQVAALKPGEVSPMLLRSGAGWHVLKLIERRDTTGIRITQTRPRHILLRLSPQLSADVAKQRLADMRAQLERGSATFESLARQFSEDGSAAQGGDLGWVNPGAFVPEFEDAMNRLPVGGISMPVETRFGVHLIEVVERRETTLDTKQVREQARNALRAQKYEEAYREWVKDLRSRAYVEMRDPP